MDKTAGYKIKSAITMELMPSQLETMNRAIANFPMYNPPKIDIFTTKEEFLLLEKNWSYCPVGSGTLAFFRLSTSGSARGRPGNPFHQIVTIDYDKLHGVLALVIGKNNNEAFVPSDYYFWEGWLSPKGDEEVENSEIGEFDFPTPVITDSEILQNFEQLLASERIRDSIRGFETSYTLHEAGFLDAESDEEFFVLLSSISRLFPNRASWVVPFSNQEFSLNFHNPDHHPKPNYKSTTTKSKGLTWSSHLLVAAENGLIDSVAHACRELEKLVRAPIGSRKNPLHISNLQHFPLALLLCGHEILTFDDRFSIKELVNYVDVERYPVAFKDVGSREKALENLERSVRQSLLTDEQADMIFNLVRQFS